jgi:hypothetical protein
MSASLQTTAGEALSLYTVQDENGQVDATVPVRWCISRETAKMLQDKKVENPHLLLVVSNGGWEISRYVVPLFNEMHYVQFLRPGENVIHATIVWYGASKKLKKHLNARYDSGSYKVDLLHTVQPQAARLEREIDELREQYYAAESGSDEEAALKAQIDQLQAELRELEVSEAKQTTIRRHFDSMHRLEHEAQLGVIVPKAMFAKEPPKWMRWLANVYQWERAPRDQCVMRRRALFTAATLPVVALIATVIFTCITVVAGLINLAIISLGLVLGLRNMNYKPLRHSYWPFEYGQRPQDILRRSGPSVWFTKKGGVSKLSGDQLYTQRSLFFKAFNPFVILLFTGLAALYGVAFGFPDGSTVWQVFRDGMIASIVFGILLMAGAKLGDGPISRWSEQRAKEREEEAKRAREALNRELELLACSGASREVKLSALPRSRRTVTLRFYDLKSKVCRPFAK